MKNKKLFLLTSVKFTTSMLISNMLPFSRIVVLCYELGKHGTGHCFVCRGRGTVSKVINTLRGGMRMTELKVYTNGFTKYNFLFHILMVS